MRKCEVGNENPNAELGIRIRPSIAMLDALSSNSLSLTDSASHAKAGALDFISSGQGWKMWPTRHGEVSCDCPLYHSLAQQPVWTHACTGHLELIHLRATRDEWAEHLRSKHEPVLTAMHVVAAAVAERHLHKLGEEGQNSTSFHMATESLSCPFGCKDVGKPGAAPRLDEEGGDWRQRHVMKPSLADKMVAALRSESNAIFAQTYYSNVAGGGAEKNQSFAAGEVRLAALRAHIVRAHMPEIQFIVSYAKELAACACAPAVLAEQPGLRDAAGGLAMGAARVTAPDFRTLKASSAYRFPAPGSFSKMFSFGGTSLWTAEGRRQQPQRAALPSLCPFYVLAESRCNSAAGSGAAAGERLGALRGPAANEVAAAPASGPLVTGAGMKAVHESRDASLEQHPQQQERGSMDCDDEKTDEAVSSCDGCSIHFMRGHEQEAAGMFSRLFPFAFLILFEQTFALLLPYSLGRPPAGMPHGGDAAGCKAYNTGLPRCAGA